MANKKAHEFTRREFLKVSAGAAGAMALGGSLMGARNMPEPIRVGLVNPLEGECAQWGIPIVRGGQIWADEHNANGGILCGDGERHKIDYKGYTNVCYFPNEELKAFKKAVLDDDKKFMFQTYTPACRRAIAQLVNQNNVLTSSYGAGYLSAEYPTLMGGITGAPTCYMALVAHILEKHPEIKRVALMFTDNSYGHSGRAYSAAGCAPYEKQGRIKVVYNDVFDPNMTDYFPLMSAVLKEKPDAIFHSDLPAGKQAILLETGYSMKYEGIWMCQTWFLDQILKRVSPEQMEGRVYQGMGVDCSLPGFNERAYNMYKAYISKYGAKDWSFFAGMTYSALVSWEPGFAASPSIDPKDVMKTLYNMPEVDHAIYGKSVWTGKEIYGCNNHLLTPSTLYVSSGGKNTLSGIYDLGPWWKEYNKYALPVLKKAGMTSA